MKLTHVSVALSAGLALAMAMGCSAQVEPSNQEPSASQASPSVPAQERIAQTTLKLESAFADQFVRGKIDRSTLPIDGVVQAMPEAARPKFLDHINRVIEAGQKLASEMTPEQRAQAAAPPAEEKVGKAVQAQIAAWGWPGYGGWGGLGAFGFPGAYSYGYGFPGAYSYGFPGGYSSGYGPACYGSYYGSPWGWNTGSYSNCGYGYSSGYGLGLGGWYW